MSDYAHEPDLSGILVDGADDWERADQRSSSADHLPIAGVRPASVAERAVE